MLLFYPITYVLYIFSKLISKLFPIEKEKVFDTEEELKILTEIVEEEGTIDEFESEFSTKHFPQVIHDHQDGRKHIGGAAEVAAYFKENNIAVPAK